MIVVILLLLLALAPGCSSTKAPPETNASANAAKIIVTLTADN